MAGLDELKKKLTEKEPEDLKKRMNKTGTENKLVKKFEGTPLLVSQTEKKAMMYMDNDTIEINSAPENPRESGMAYLKRHNIMLGEEAPLEEVMAKKLAKAPVAEPIMVAEEIQAQMKRQQSQKLEQPLPAQAQSLDKAPMAREARPFRSRLFAMLTKSEKPKQQEENPIITVEEHIESKKREQMLPMPKPETPKKPRQEPVLELTKQGTFRDANEPVKTQGVAAPENPEPQLQQQTGKLITENEINTAREAMRHGIPLHEIYDALDLDGFNNAQIREIIKKANAQQL